MVRRISRGSAWAWALVPLGIVAVLCIVVGTAYLVDSVQYRVAIAGVGQIDIGDSKDDVVRTIGKPFQVWPKGSYWAWREVEGRIVNKLYFMNSDKFETWLYGKSFRSLSDAFANHSLFRFRFHLFGTDPDDIVVEFDDQGKVVRVQVPTESEK